MTKIILRVLLVFFLIVILFITYLSVIGVKTTKFNNEIGNLIKDFNKDLLIELKEVKIILDPIKFELNVKTIGPKFTIKGKNIELENIVTKVSINSFLKDEFSVKNLEISTKSIKLENLISFFRKIKNTPELFVLEKVIKKGYVISDIRLEFNDNGEIKNNYKINGLLKDAQINLSKKFNFDKIDLTFNFENKIVKLNDINLFVNNTQLFSEKIIVKNVKKEFLIEGFITNKDVSLDDKFVENFVKLYLPNLDFKKLNFSSKNDFLFNINKKFKVNNFKLSSEIQLNKLTFKDQFDFKKFIPNNKKEINFDNHLINIKYDKKKLSIDGSGNILFQNKKELINYKIKKKNELIDFETNLNIVKNPIIIDFLGYKKTPESKANISLKGSHLTGKKTIIEMFSINENKNKLIINDLILNKNFKIKSLKKIDLDYLDEDMRENKISLLNNEKNYNLVGSKFNANNLIDNLIDNKNSKGLKIFDKDFNLDVKIDQVYLDKEYIINDLTGKLDFKRNEILSANLNAFFSKDKKFKFTISTNQNEKVTTLFLDQAEPIVKRYKFIKGYKGGSLDFSSSKKNNKSNSKLKIYNFRLKELPVLTKILTLASLQGIADILSGEGITFDEFEMNFNNIDNLVTIEEMYAIGPAISILMDGYIEKNKLVSLRGSLVPATTINKVIGNIPVLGKILVGSKTGEGVFGVSFKIKGHPKNLETSVNPIKTLTPRFITRTLEKIKKN